VLGESKITCKAIIVLLKTTKSAVESLRVLAGAVRVLVGAEIRLVETTMSVLSEA
jgi:hypothetical protein